MSAHTPIVTSLNVGTRNPLERHVKNWINNRAKEYSTTGVEGVVRDLYSGGCASGIVEELTYDEDAAKFYRKYAKVINALVDEALQNGSYHSLAEVFGSQWDSTDPLVLERSNQTLVARFAFAEVAQQLVARAELNF